MRTYANPPAFDDTKFSVVYGRNASPEDGGSWCRRMVNGVPTLLYPDSGPALASSADFAPFAPDEPEDSKFRQAVLNSALFDDVKWGAFTAIQRDNFNREVNQRLAKLYMGLKQ